MNMLKQLECVPKSSFIKLIIQKSKKAVTPNCFWERGHSLSFLATVLLLSGNAMMYLHLQAFFVVWLFFNKLHVLKCNEKLSSGYHPSDSHCNKQVCVFWMSCVSLKSNIEVYVHIYPHTKFRLFSIPKYDIYRNDQIPKKNFKIFSNNSAVKWLFNYELDVWP